MNKNRVFKNTMYLYLRMIIVLLISLYSSRIVLNVLGVEDYGIYCVIGSIVTSFLFFSSSLGGTTSRYLLTELGKNNINKYNEIFNTALVIHCLLAVLIGFIAEVIGIWYINNKLVIPLNRLSSGIFVFHISIICAIISIVKIPFTSSIVAHEDINVTATLEIFESLIRLTLIFVIQYLNQDKLIIYSTVIFVVSFLDLLFKIIYCRRHYIECTINYCNDKHLILNILNYASWDTLGCLSIVAQTNGINILINIFFGLIMNTAYGISLQINSLVNHLSGQVFTAIKPQIIKLYASNQINEMRDLIYIGSKVAGVLFILFAIPLYVEVEFVLDLWLGIYPKHTIVIARILLIQSLVITLSRPIVMSVHAIGIVKSHNLYSATVVLSILPLSYILLNCNICLELIMIINVIPWILECLIDCFLIRNYIRLNITNYFIGIYFRVLLFGGILLFIICQISEYSTEKCFAKFVTIGIVSIILSFITSYIFIMNDRERDNIKCRAGNLLNKILLLIRR